MLKPGQLPRFADLRRLASHHAVMKGQVAVAELQRFAELLVSSDGECDVELRGELEEEGRCTVLGSAACEVKVLCQRCLEPMILPLSAEIALGVVASDEEAAELPDNLDPVIQGADAVDIYEIVTDELILALPIVSYHAPEDCSVAQDYSTGTQEEEVVAAKPNPFSVLAGLKTSNTSDSDS